MCIRFVHMFVLDICSDSLNELYFIIKAQIHTIENENRVRATGE